MFDLEYGSVPLADYVDLQVAHVHWQPNRRNFVISFTYLAARGRFIDDSHGGGCHGDLMALKGTKIVRGRRFCGSWATLDPGNENSNIGDWFRVFR